MEHIGGHQNDGNDDKHFDDDDDNWHNMREVFMEDIGDT